MNDRTPPQGWVEGLLYWISVICTVLASIALVVLVVTFGWLVFGRYVLGDTPTWVNQLALLLICYIVFLGTVSGVRDDTHLGVSLFRDMTPVVVQKSLIISIDAILAIFGGIMCVAGSTLVRFGWDSLLPALDIPESFRTAAITICGALICLTCTLRFFNRLVNFKRWHPAAVVRTDNLET